MPVVNIVHSALNTVYVFYLLFQFWSHRHLYKDMKQKSHKLSVKIPINPRFISERRIFSGETLKASKSESPSVAGSRLGALLGASGRQINLRSPSETTLTTSSVNAPVNDEKTIDSHPTIRLVTQGLKDHGTDPSPGSSGPSLPKSRWQSEDDVSIITEETHRNPPGSMSTVALAPPGQGSTLSVESFKEPRMSLTMTLLLLTTVTIVSCI
jgi:Ca2+:H+ antiporter